MVHEQKFKDLLSSKCQASVEIIVFDLESEAAWVLFPPGVTFLPLNFFSRSKASDVSIANIVNLRKSRLVILPLLPTLYSHIFADDFII